VKLKRSPLPARFAIIQPALVNSRNQRQVIPQVR
jgi:hypothetical protein